jgi:hypothetical protein
MELSAGCFGSFAVLFGVRLGSFCSMVGGVMMMAGGDVCVVRCQVMIPFFVVPCGFAMMLRRVFVMLGSLVVMLDCLCRHFVLLGKFTLEAWPT